MIRPSASDVDVVVIGGGPAGSTAGALIAQRGYRVRLFEREKFPRFHIGESLIPETYHVLERLGLIETLRNSSFVKKHSVQFVLSDGRISEPFYFADHKPHPSSQTWQVLRSEFDELLLNNARRLGVDAQEEVRVLEVLFEGTRARGVRIQTAAGREEEVTARVVIDASGQSTLIAQRLKLLDKDPVLKKGAIWTYFEGAQRDSGRDEGATLVLQTDDRKGWFWYIPLHQNQISVGIVRPFDELFDPARGQDHETIYAQELDRCPAVKQRVSIGRRVAPFYATKDYSYRSRQNAGDGWVLVGDACGFLDPLYSSGVLLALKSAQLAADAVSEGLARNDTSAAQIGAWGPNYFQGMERMRRLVCEYYDGFSFGRFVREYPHLKGLLTDVLIGDLFEDKVDALIEPMAAFRARKQEANAARAAAK